MATEIDTKEAVRIDPEQIVTLLESYYHASRGFMKPETHLTVSIALLQHHDMERLTRALEKIRDLIDTTEGLIVTAYPGEV